MRKIDALDILKGKVREMTDIMNGEFGEDTFYYCDYLSLFDSDLDEYFMNNPYSAIRWASTIDRLLTIIKYYKTEKDKLEHLYDTFN